MQKFYSNIDFISNSTDLKSFYDYFNKEDICKVEMSRILELRKKAKEVYFKKSAPSPEDYTLPRKYLNALNHIKMNPKKYGITCDAEKYILATFYLDPEFFAYKQFIKEQDLKKTRIIIKNTLGIYDPNLICIENILVRMFAKHMQREKAKVSVK